MNKIINWREELINLFPETTERKLLDNHKWCEKCNGLGLYKEGKSLFACNYCKGTGQAELCQNKCGNEKHKYTNLCESCLNKSDDEKRIKMELYLFNKAEKINYCDYDGNFFIDDIVKDKDDFEEWMFERLLEEDLPKYVYGTKKEKIMGINFTQIIEDECENGYEEMGDRLNYDGVEEIQTMIDKWIENQGDANYCYWEDHKVIVLLDDLINQLKKEK